MSGTKRRGAPRLRSRWWALSWCRSSPLAAGAAISPALLGLQMHELASADESGVARVVLLAPVFGIAMLPVAAPPLAVALLGERARPTLDALNAFVTEHRRGVTATACVVFAVALGISGAAQIL